MAGSAPAERGMTTPEPRREKRRRVARYSGNQAVGACAGKQGGTVR